MPPRPGELAAALVARHRAVHDSSCARAEELRTGLARTVARALGAGVARRAWLIGSLAWGARGAFGEGSDVDVVVEGASLEGAAALWRELHETLRVEVDLSRLEALTPTFAARVERDGVLLHGT